VIAEITEVAETTWSRIVAGAARPHMIAQFNNSCDR
jgi:hypothetical protein